MKGVGLLTVKIIKISGRTRQTTNSLQCNPPIDMPAIDENGACNYFIDQNTGFSSEY
jgi:hypothetical protein